jgi:hypothetical protein
MRYRRLDAAGDMVFGASAADFLVNSAEAVAQAVRTRLGLQRGEWFLDTEEGIDWRAEVLGKYTGETRDFAVRSRVLGTTGVTAIAEYGSVFDPETRRFVVQLVIDTVYGQATIQETL